MTERSYHVLLYGATGFVGRQTVAYLATHAPEGLRWAIAGRNRAKLEAVKAQVGERAESAAIQVADSHDQAAVDAIVAQTQVVLNTAGPFALYGTPIVDACVRSHTHYVDITGETPWVKDLIHRYHDQAAADGTRIIPFCGFDSIPSDLGTYLVVRHMQRALGTDCTQVKAYFQASGGFNGGTLASGFNLYESGQATQVGDPFLLNPPDTVSPDDIRQSPDLDRAMYDADMETWVAPFFMAPINTRVVRRSQALYAQWGDPYGHDFTYQECLKFDPPFAKLHAAGVTAGMAVLGGAIAQPWLRPALKTLLPKPGTGPSAKTMDSGWFRCDLVGQSRDGHRVHGRIQDQGDPGNRATVKFLCESALCLALSLDALPGGRSRGGILTPATGLGNVLAARLQDAGMSIAVS